MRIWSILLIKSNLKWCIHLSRSLFLYNKKIFSLAVYLIIDLQSFSYNSIAYVTIQNEITDVPRIFSQLKDTFSLYKLFSQFTSDIGLLMSI